MVRDLDVRIKYAYLRLKRNLALYFTLWFLALLAAVSLVIDSIFIPNNSSLRVWSSLLVILLFIKLSYDVYTNMRNQYEAWKEAHKQTDSTLRKL